MFYKRGFILIFFLNFTLFAFAQTNEDSSSTKKFRTKIIGHRGGCNGTTIPNSLSSIKQSISHLDGIEVDIFLSKDRTLWLSHNQKLESCELAKQPNILKLTDSEINDINSCGSGKYEYTRLSDVFSFLSQNYPEKYISLDLKPWIPCGFSSINIPHLRTIIAKNVCKLQEQYQLKNILVESESLALMKYIKMHNALIHCYLLTLKKPSKYIKKAIHGKIDGISLKYFSMPKISLKDMETLQQNKLTIQVWTINSIEDLKNIQTLKIDFIQSDLLSQ